MGSAPTVDIGSVFYVSERSCYAGDYTFEKHRRAATDHHIEASDLHSHPLDNEYEPVPVKTEMGREHWKIKNSPPKHWDGVILYDNDYSEDL